MKDCVVLGSSYGTAMEILLKGIGQHIISSKVSGALSGVAIFS